MKAYTWDAYGSAQRMLILVSLLHGFTDGYFW
jgi:hypothetical protein